jgi:hypothetical protein
LPAEEGDARMIQGERRTYYRAASPQNAVKTPFAPIREICGKNPPQKIFNNFK